MGEQTIRKGQAGRRAAEGVKNTSVGLPILRRKRRMNLRKNVCRKGTNTTPVRSTFTSQHCRNASSLGVRSPRTF